MSKVINSRLQQLIRSFFSGDIDNGLYARVYTIVRNSDVDGHWNVVVDNEKAKGDVEIILAIDPKYVRDDSQVRISIVDRKVRLEMIDSDANVTVVPQWSVVKYQCSRYTETYYLVTGNQSLAHLLYKDIVDAYEYAPIPQMCYMFANIAVKSWQHSVCEASVVGENRQCFYEILGAARSKFYIDIDFIEVAKLYAGIKEIVVKIKQLFDSEFSETISDSQIVVLRSFPDKQIDGVNKASVHIVVNSAKAFVDPANISQLMVQYGLFDRSLLLSCDKNVYRMWQKFRVVESAKSEHDIRVFKRVNFGSEHEIGVAIDFDPVDTLIQCYRDTYPDNHFRDIMMDPKGYFAAVVNMTDDEFEKVSSEINEMFRRGVAKTWTKGMTRHLGAYLRSLENSERMYDLFVSIIEGIIEEKNISHSRINLHPLEQVAISNPVRTDRPWINAQRMNGSRKTILEFIGALFIEGISRDDDDNIIIEFTVSYGGEYLSGLNRSRELNYCESHGFKMHQTACGDAYVVAVTVVGDKAITVLINGEPAMEGKDVMIINLYAYNDKHTCVTLSKGVVKRVATTDITTIRIMFSMNAPVDPANKILALARMSVSDRD